MAKTAVAKKPLTKTQLITNLAESTELNKKDVVAVLEALSEEIKKSLAARGPGAIAIPGLVKITKKKVPAKPAQKNVMILGQLRDVAAKPARTKVVVRALKNLKDMV